MTTVEVIWGWMRENREWLLAAAGVIATIVGWWLGRSYAQRSDRGSTSIQGDVSNSPVQSLQVGNCSTVQQAVTVHHGVTLEQAESVAIRTFEANMIRLAGVAAEIAHGRVAEFTHALFGRLAQDSPESLNRANDPGFMGNVYEAQKQYATSGDESLQTTLIELLRDSAAAESGSLRDISLRQAIAQVGKVTARQRDIMALVFVLTRVRWEAFYGSDQLSQFAADYLEPLLGAGVHDPNNYSHLTSIGCLEVGPSKPDIIVFFMTHWRTALSAGIPREEAKKLEAASCPEYWSMFQPFAPGSDLLRLRGQTNETIKQLASQIGIPEKFQSSIFGLDAKYMLKSPDREEFIRSVHPAIRALWEVWHAPHAPLPRSNLTTLGVTFAHARLSALGKAIGPLASWLAG